jgi:putative ABC transport system permease protein
MPLIENLVQDVRRSVRSLGRAPGFTIAATLTLALGIGATSTVFSVVDTVLLRPLPYDEPSRRVMIWSRWKDFDKTWVSDAEVLDYRTRCRTLAAVAAWGTGQANLTGDGEPIRIGIAQVTANAFRVLGSAAITGRTFADGEDQAGRDQLAVISSGLWQRRYGGDAHVVGRTIRLDGVPRTIVGVMPAGFQLPTDFGEDAAEPTQAWVPLTLDADPDNRGNHGLYAAATLAPGATVAAANAELRAVTAANTRAGLYPSSMQFGAMAVPVEEEILGTAKPAVWILAGAVAFLLLIACANVANLLLARAEGRHREMALRAALGGGGSRLVAQLLTESLVLATFGAVAGVALAVVATHLVAAARIDAIPRLASVSLNGRALFFTGILTVACTMVFGLVPALRALRIDLVDSLKQGARAGIGGHRRRVRGLLVVIEMSLAVMLVIGAGLMLRSLWSLYRVPLGIDPTNVLTARLSLPEASYNTPQKTVLFYQALLDRIRLLPTVRHAGIIRSLPLAATIGDWGLDVDGYPETPGNRAKGDWQVASDDAAEALGERLVRGRFFSATDTADSIPVAVVNETMARKYWAGRAAVGGRIRMGRSDGGRPWLTVVGVVGDVRHNGITGAVKEKFYVPHSQFHRSVQRAITGMTLMVKTSADPLSLVASVRAAVRALDPDVPIAAVRPMADVVANATATERFTGVLLFVFSTLALVLAAIGIYGVLAYLVSQRTHEIGVRMAVGANGGDVVRMVLGHGLALSLAGAALGVVGALALTRLMTSVLHGVAPTDPLTFVTVPIALAFVALGASAIPAYRATRVDPLHALRAE